MSEPIPLLKKGDPVRLNGRHLGRVLMASDNGRSVLVELEEGLPVGGGFFLNFAAIDVNFDEATAVELHTRQPVEIEVPDERA